MEKKKIIINDNEKLSRYVKAIDIPDRERDGGEDRFDWYADIVKNDFKSLFIGFVNIRKSEKNLITKLERHNKTNKILILVDGDAVFNFAITEKGELPKPEDIESFLIKKGTILILNTGVWHFAPMAYDEKAKMIVMVEKDTYQTDCEIADLSEYRIEIF